MYTDHYGHWALYTDSTRCLGEMYLARVLRKQRDAVGLRDMADVIESPALDRLLEVWCQRRERNHEY